MATRSFRGPDAANDADEGQPFRKRQGTGNCVRTAGGVSKDAEPVDTKLVGNREDIGRPIAVSPTDLVRRAAKARAIDPNEAHTSFIERGAENGLIEIQPRSRDAVEENSGVPSRRPNCAYATRRPDSVPTDPSMTDNSGSLNRLADPAFRTLDTAMMLAT